MAWFRVHTDIIDDPKMMSLTECQFRQFILMLCFAAEINDSGKFREHNHKAIAWRLRARANDIQNLINKLTELNIITNKNGYLEFINWEKRQYSESYSRVKKHRDLKRYSNASSNTKETADTDTDTDTDTDKEKIYKKEKPVSNDKIVFDGSSGKFENISPSLVEKWGEAFPALNVPAEIKKAAVWLLANPKNKKSNYERFLANWFSRAQDKAPRAGNGDSVILKCPDCNVPLLPAEKKGQYSHKGNLYCRDCYYDPDRQKEIQNQGE